MLFQDSKDESAFGLALVGLGMVVMAAILGTITGNVQPKAPVEESHPDVSSPYLHEGVPSAHTHPGTSSTYPQPPNK